MVFCEYRNSYGIKICISRFVINIRRFLAALGIPNESRATGGMRNLPGYIRNDFLKSYSLYCGISYANRLTQFFIKISLFLIKIIPGIDLFIFVHKVHVKQSKIAGTHSCMNEKEYRKAPFP